MIRIFDYIKAQTKILELDCVCATNIMTGKGHILIRDNDLNRVEFIVDDMKLYPLVSVGFSSTWINEVVNICNKKYQVASKNEGVG